MNILIVSATYLEIESLLTHFSFIEQKNQKLHFYTYKNHTVDVLISGVGMTSTAYWLGKTLNSNVYDCAINLGIAGSFNDSVRLGEVVNITSDRISELGAEDGENFLSLIDMNLIVDEGFISPNGEMMNTIQIENEELNSLRKVKSITVNTAHGEESSIKKITQLFNPDTETMEGAAFYYACLLEGIKCTQVRAISNKVKPRNKENWDIPLALSNLTKASLKLLDNM